MSNLLLRSWRVPLLLLVLLSSVPLWAADLPRLPERKPGLDEHLGAQIPLELKFVDENGHQVRLADLVDRPTILAPVYYRCTNVCNLLQGAIAEVLPKLNQDPQQLRVISLSFDPDETPKIAIGSRRIYQAAMGDKFPAGQWSFLTGSQENIDRLMETIGYSYTKQGIDFIHPVAIVILSPQGKVVRYLYGTRYLPMDISLALMEASEGRIGNTISRIASFCYSYDPEKKSYVFDFLRVAGTIIFASLGILFLVLVYGGKKNKPS